MNKQIKNIGMAMAVSLALSSTPSKALGEDIKVVNVINSPDCYLGSLSKRYTGNNYRDIFKTIIDDDSRVTKDASFISVVDLENPITPVGYSNIEQFLSNYSGSNEIRLCLREAPNHYLKIREIGRGVTFRGERFLSNQGEIFDRLTNPSFMGKYKLELLIDGVEEYSLDASFNEGRWTIYDYNEKKDKPIGDLSSNNVELRKTHIPERVHREPTRLRL